MPLTAARKPGWLENPVGTDTHGSLRYATFAGPKLSKRCDITSSVRSWAMDNSFGDSKSPHATKIKNVFFILLCTQGQFFQLSLSFCFLRKKRENHLDKSLAHHDMDARANFGKATRWLSWYGVGLASADRLPVVVRIPAGPLGSLKCDPPKGNGRRPQKKTSTCSRAQVQRKSKYQRA